MLVPAVKGTEADGSAVRVTRHGSDEEDRARTKVGSSTEEPSLIVSRAVKRAQDGDREAIGFLYARYSDNVYGYVCSIVHDHHEAEDVTQHVFAKLIHVIGKYEERDVPFFAWILRVARNVAIDHLRRRQRTIPVEEVRAVGNAAPEQLDTGCMSDLRESLSRLSTAQQEVLVLRHVAGLSPMEIARRTGRSEGSIHGLHHRGRKALVAELTVRNAAPSTLTGRCPARELAG